MSPLEIGTWGYQIGALGIGVFTIAFLVSVRWWTDTLGRLLAGLFTIMSAILVTGAYRALEPGDTPAFLAWRAVLYSAFGLVMWLGVFTFVWVQFFAPRVKHRKERRNAEADLADSRHGRHGGSHDRSGRPH